MGIIIHIRGHFSSLCLFILIWSSPSAVFIRRLNRAGLEINKNNDGQFNDSHRCHCQGFMKKALTSCESHYPQLSASPLRSRLFFTRQLRAPRLLLRQVSSYWMGKSSSFPPLFHHAMCLVSHEKYRKHANHQTLRIYFLPSLWVDNIVFSYWKSDTPYKHVLIGSLAQKQ